MTVAEPSVVAVEGLRKTFRTDQQSVAAVEEVSFTVEPGELYTLLGPSGCGKTTTLRCIAGLERPDAGTIQIGGKMVSGGARRSFVPPHRRNIGMVFQSYAIWPHMTVFDNVAFPLRVSHVRGPEVRSRVMEVLEVVGLAGLADRLAPQLSGGQQQRTALARALVGRPRLLLLDEPLSNLDAKLREAMRDELRGLQRRLGVTAIYVTHDQLEALSLSTRIAVMHRGRVMQEGLPAEIYEHPATRFVAEFVGASNFLEGQLVAQRDGRARVRTSLGELVVVSQQAAPAGSTVNIAFRPEHLSLHAAGSARTGPAENTMEGVIVEAQYLGEAIDYVVEVGDLRLRSRMPAAMPLTPGQQVRLELPARSCALLEA